MAADLTLLVPAFRDAVNTLTARCLARGVTMRPNIGLRDPLEQARLWRQSRSIEEITQQIQRLDTAGASFLAACVRRVGPQHGDHVTDAIPGLSWHQWGEALDYFWLVDGQAIWSSTKLVGGLNGYKVLAEEATALGLMSGGSFTKLKDWPHVQQRPEGSPLGTFSLVQIDAQMQARFPNLIGP